MKVRPYQIELLERAIKENIITYLDTGCGKTLVSILLLQHLLKPGSLGIFLAPTNALVHQQANSIRSVTGLSVGDYTSQNSSLINWSHDDWKAQFASIQVLVMTPQLCLNLLRHGYIDFSQVELVIFDECHHGNKGHPYTLIMNEYYHTLEGKKPRILGLTASPIGHGIVNAKQLQDRMTALQKLFDSKIITIVDRAHVGSYVVPITEIIVQFDKWVDLEENSEFNETFSQLTGQFEEQGEIDTKKQLNAIKYLKEQFGWPVTKKFVELQFGNVIKKRKASDMESPFEPSLLSPKLIALIRLIKTHYSANGRCMVFVDRKATAVVLCALINQISSKEFPEVKCGYLTGSSGGIKEREINLIGHKETINYFRSGKYNTLVVTRVAEEGLDISSIGYIQSRGRARSPNGSKYIILVEKDNLGNWKHIVDAKKTENLTRSVALQLMDGDADLHIDKNFNDDEIITLLSGDMDLPLETKAGAKLFPSGSIQLLHWTCAVMQDIIEGDSLLYNQEMPGELDWESILQILHSQYIDGIGNEYELELLRKQELDFGYIYSCTFLLNGNLVKVYGYPRMNKRIAKFHAAFLTCCFLHKHHVIDDRLLPKQTSKTTVESSKSIGEEILDDFIPSAFIPTAKVCEYHITPILIAESDIQVCILTPQVISAYDIPQFDLYFEQKRFTAKFGLNKTITVSEVELSTLDQYSKTIWQYALNTNQKVANYDKSGYFGEIESRKYYVAPLKNNIIDWQSIRDVIGYKKVTLTKTNQLKDMVVFTKHNNRKYYNLDFHNGVNSSTEFEKTTGAKKIRISYKDYFDDLGYTITDASFPVRAYAVPLIRNCLINTEESAHREAILLSEACTACPISKSMLRLLHLVPTILWKLHIGAAIDDFFNTFGYEKLPKSIVYPAFITPNADESINYDRLEILGDAFLKYASSIYLYSIKELKSEGALSKQRSVIVSNSTLTRIAKALKTSKFLTVIPFSSSFWAPPGLKPWRLVNPDPDEKPPPKIAGSKTFADFMEALIGAYWRYSNEEGAWYIASQLKILPELKVVQENLSTLPIKQTQSSLIDFDRLEAILGYKFNQKSLLTLCFTHPTFNPKFSYERLEFLGDSILDFLLIKYCFEKYPQTTPGMLSKLKQAAVNNESLARLSFKLQLNEFVLINSTIIERDLEEYIAYLKSGNVFIDPFETLVEDTFITPEAVSTSPVRLMMEHFQADAINSKDISFKYFSRNQGGNFDSHECVIFLKGLEIARGFGNTKVMAKKRAAKECLEWMKNK
ncbi:hypothetical protein HDV04_001105 [Boothiomyces sp. JEL0838]|nr:hypothetical protein HDV04_001105 [Boothiomyces sp. JEL0838]